MRWISAGAQLKRLLRAARMRELALAGAVLVTGMVGGSWAVLALEASPGQARFSVLLDAAHGGAETGTHLRPRLEEKDLTLALSVWLRSNFTAHGMAVTTTRENDMDLTGEKRAALANGAHPAACLLLHATASGTGVHLYTSALAPAAALPPGELQPWATAQAPYVTQSLKLSSDLSEALAHAGVPAIQGSVSVAPVDNMGCPAVLVELAPPRAGAAIDDRGYETRVVDALSAALSKWQADWRAAP